MKTTLKYYVRAILFLFPILFLPFMIDGSGVGKNWFFGVSAIVGLIIWVADLLINKREIVKLNKVWWLFLVLVVWASVSFFRLSDGIQMKSLVSPLGYGTLISLLAWMFLWIQVNEKGEYKKQILALSASGLIVAITSLVTFLIPSSKLPIIFPQDNPWISINTGWSLTGSIVTEAILLVFLLVEWVRRLLKKLKSKEQSVSYIMEAVATGVFGLILLLDIYRIIKTGWVILDYYSAWVIAVETLKSSPIWGVGIGNFLRAFEALRPVSYNLTGNWTTIFSASSMGILHVWTELGLVGLVIILSGLSAFLKQRGKKDFWQVGLMIAIVLFLPLNLISMFLLGFILVNKISETKQSKLILKVGENGFNAMPWVLGGVLMVVVVLGSYWWVRILMGEVYLRKSLVAASKNDGGSTYNLQIKAIGMNPRLAEYRKIYSQTNLALAQNLLANKEISDEDKEKASTLVQQAVREAKAAVALDELNSSYWNNLAAIYKSLIGLVDGVADWSFQAYQQAVALDPVNPILKVDMGGLLYAANRFEEADRVFEQVVMNKNDFANGWYNWAYTAKNMNRLGDAVSRLDQAVRLVPVDSGDYDKANEELTAWKKELDELIKKQQELAKQQQANQVVKQPETLKTAEPLPTVGEEERVNVPAEELQPPETVTEAPQEQEATGENPTP